MDAAELFKEVLGLDADAERQEAVLAAYQAVLREIEKLRALDLTDVHPAVVFAPATSPSAEV